MAKIPESAKKEIPQKCKICERVFKSKEFLVSHIESKHNEDIPKDWSASRYENYLRTGKTSGHCVVCKKETEWNESTWKYARLCTDKKCRDTLRKSANKNMVSKYGKTTLLNDADQQRKMIYAKKTSGKYYWSTDTTKQYPKYYASQVELKFLELLDAFMGLEMDDVLSPSPNNYTYKYENKDHLYIPDVYIISLNLEVEIKEPLNNQNMHPKIQAVDKVKEKLKDELMESIPYVNYIKINGTDYRQFFEYYSYLKNCPDASKNITSSDILEALGDIEDDNFNKEVNEAWEEMMREPVTELTDRGRYEDIINIGGHIASASMDILDPKLSYKTTINKLKYNAENCNSLPTAKIIKDNIRTFKNHLRKVLQDKNKRELHYEAKKALKELDKIEDLLELRIDKLKRLGGQMFVTDGYDKKAWYRPLKESYITGYRNDMEYRPIFVFLSYTGTTMGKLIKTMTDGTFSHASISLNTDMRNMCSFVGTGFVDEDILSKNYAKDVSIYALYMYMAPKIEYDTIESLIQQFTENKDKLKYSVQGLINYLKGKETYSETSWFCSEFVAYLLNQANPKLFNRHYSLYSPDDLTKTRKFVKISSGKILDYNPDKVDRIIRKVLNRKGFEYVDIEHS